MVIKRQFITKCRACGEQFDLYEYEGFEGSRYGNHFCEESCTFWLKNPRARTLCFAKDTREVKRT
jgi:hypothetical protein